MPRHALQRPVALVMAALAVAAGTAGAARLTQTSADRPAPCSRDAGRAGDDGESSRHALPGLPTAAAAAGCAPQGALPDKPAKRLSVVDKARIVMLVASGEARGSEVAAQYRVSGDQAAVWKRQLLVGDWPGLMRTADGTAP